MAELKLVYSELEDASENAKKVAGKCQDYWDELDTKLSKKWSTLPATPLNVGNQRIDSASYYVNQKKMKLAEKKKDYTAFATAVDNLIENAKNADMAVAKSVNGSRKTFLDAHNNLSGDGWAAFFATVVVDVPVIGWIAEGISSIGETLSDFGNNIRHWYEVDGGKKVVDTILAIGEGVLAVCALVAAIATFPVSGVLAIISAVAGLVAGIIGIVDAAVNIYHQYKANKQSDPAWAQYYGGIDKASDALRKTTFKSKFINKWSGTLALAWDVTAIVCDGIEGLEKIYKRSGLNKLFSSKKTSTVRGVVKNEYIFDFTKFKKTVTSKDGWSSIKKTLKHSWKGLLFGDSGGVDGWKKRWKRAFTSKTNYKKEVGFIKKTYTGVRKIYNRVNKVYNVAKSDFDTAKTAYETIVNVKELFSGKKWEKKDVYTNIKNVYKIAGGDGKLVNLTTGIIDESIEVYEENQKMKKYG